VILENRILQRNPFSGLFADRIFAMTRGKIALEGFSVEIIPSSYPLKIFMVRK
jgi:ABC-type enterochelin transport system ATPase subunit